jgi:hypothetical protein
VTGRGSAAQTQGPAGAAKSPGRGQVGPEAPPPFPTLRGPHLQRGDVLVVELVLAVAQHQRRLPHAAFAQQHHLERVGSARRPAAAAAGRSHPAAPRPPEPENRAELPTAAAGSGPPHPLPAPLPSRPGAGSAPSSGEAWKSREKVLERRAPHNTSDTRGKAKSSPSPPPSNGVSFLLRHTPGHVTAAARAALGLGLGPAGLRGVGGASGLHPWR